LCAACPTTVTVITPDPPPYTAGDELTCSSDAYPDATYSWTVDMSAGSSTSTQVLYEGEFVYVCTATHIAGGEQCTAVVSTPSTVTAYSKYQNSAILLQQYCCEIHCLYANV